MIIFYATNWLYITGMWGIFKLLAKLHQLMFIRNATFNVQFDAMQVAIHTNFKFQKNRNTWYVQLSTCLEAQNSNCIEFITAQIIIFIYFILDIQ